MKNTQKFLKKHGVGEEKKSVGKDITLPMHAAVISKVEEMTQRQGSESKTRSILEKYGVEPSAKGTSIATKKKADPFVGAIINTQPYIAEKDLSEGMATPYADSALFKAVARVRSGKSVEPSLEEVYAAALPIYQRDTYIPAETYAAAAQRAEAPKTKSGCKRGGSTYREEDDPFLQAVIQIQRESMEKEDNDPFIRAIIDTQPYIARKDSVQSTVTPYAAAMQRVETPKTEDGYQRGGLISMEKDDDPFSGTIINTQNSRTEEDELRRESRIRTQLAKGVSMEELIRKEEIQAQRTYQATLEDMERESQMVQQDLRTVEQLLGKTSIAQETSPGPEVNRQMEGLRKWRDSLKSRQDQIGTQYYYQRAGEQLNRLYSDQGLTQTYDAARELDEDLWKLSAVLNGDEASDSRLTEYRAELGEKYQTEDLWKLTQVLTAQKKQLSEVLNQGGVDYETVAEFGKRLEREEKYREEQEKSRAFAEKYPVISSATSILATPFQGMEYGEAVLKGFGHSNSSKLESYVPADVYDMHATNFVRNVRGTVAQKLEEIPAFQMEIGGQNIYSFLYQTGMSMGDFLFNSMLTGNFSGGVAGAGTEAAKETAKNLSLAIMGAGAASNATVDAIGRGLSNRQAFALGAMAGAAEIITEKVSLETLLDKTSLNKSALGYWAKNVLAEGSEEVASDLINLVADVMIAKDKSQWKQAVAAYTEQGFKESEAFGLALRDQAVDMGMSFLGGGLSGGVMAGGNIAISEYLNQPSVMGRVSNGMAEIGEYRAVKPQNVEMPTVPLIELSTKDIPGIKGVLPQTGESLRQDAVKRARSRLGLDQRSAAYIPASNVMRDGNEYILKVTKRTLNKMLYPAAGAALPVESIVVMDNLERIANNGVYFKSEGDRDARQQIPGWDHLMTTVYIDGVPYSVDMRVKLVEERPGSGPNNVLYYYSPEEIMKIEKVGPEAPTVERRALNMNSELEPTSDIRLPQKADGVKGQFAQSGDPFLQAILNSLKGSTLESAEGQPYQSDDPFVRILLGQKELTPDSTESQPGQSDDPFLQIILNSLKGSELDSAERQSYQSDNPFIRILLGQKELTPDSTEGQLDQSDDPFLQAILNSLKGNGLGEVKGQATEENGLEKFAESDISQSGEPFEKERIVPSALKKLEKSPGLSNNVVMLKLYAKTTDFVEDESIDTSIGYDAKKDVIVYNPKKGLPYGVDKDGILYHELAHRAAKLAYGSLKNPVWDSAIKSAEMKVMERAKEIQEWFDVGGKYRYSPFLSDIFNVLSRGKIVTLYSRKAEELGSDFIRANEIFANIAAIDALGVDRDEILDGIYEAFKEIIEGGIN